MINSKSLKRWFLSIYTSPQTRCSPEWNGSRPRVNHVTRPVYASRTRDFRARVSRFQGRKRNRSRGSSRAYRPPRSILARRSRSRIGRPLDATLATRNESRIPSFRRTNDFHLPVKTENELVDVDLTVGSRGNVEKARPSSAILY